MKTPTPSLLLILCLSLAISGCYKSKETPTALSAGNLIQDSMVATPRGMMSRSHVHLIPSGHHLMIAGGHVLEVDAAENMIADLGVRQPAKAQTAAPVTTTTSSSPASASNIIFSANTNSWVTWAYWEAAATSSITNFSTTWIVPNQPVTDEGQILSIFDGVEDSGGTDIIQPVLLWGGNGNNWMIVNFYYWNGGYDAATTAGINVDPGTSLTGTISSTSQGTDGSYIYTCSFAGYNNSLEIEENETASTGSIIPFVTTQPWAFEALETYHSTGVGVLQPSDYPAGQNFVTMGNINLSLNGQPSAAPLTTQNGNAQFGESTVVLASPATGFPVRGVAGIPYAAGEVNIYFHPVPKINGDTILNLSTNPNTEETFTITGYPGSQVQVIFTAPPPSTFHPGIGVTPSGTSTITASLTTPGVVFSNGASAVTVEDQDVAYTVTIPSSGQITGVAEFTYTGSPIENAVSIAVY